MAKNKRITVKKTSKVKSKAKATKQIKRPKKLAKTKAKKIVKKIARTQKMKKNKLVSKVAKRGAAKTAKKKVVKTKSLLRTKSKSVTSHKKALKKKTVNKKAPKKKVAVKLKKVSIAKKKPLVTKKAAPLKAKKVAVVVKPKVAPPKRTKIKMMSVRDMNHFRLLLMRWRADLMAGVDKTIHHMQDEAANFADPNDRATQEEEFSLELRTRDRERKLMIKIDEALERIENGEYGLCEECGIEIGRERLEARPTATLCIDCKTLDEIREKQIAS